jgi:hypothetical protein
MANSSAIVKQVDQQTVEAFCKQLDRQEEGFLAMLQGGKQVLSADLMDRCFTALADIRAARMSAALIVFAVQIDLPSAAGLSLSLQFYLAARGAEAQVKAWKDVQTAMDLLVDEVKELSTEAIARAKFKTKAEERNAHGWFWRFVHPW